MTTSAGWSVVSLQRQRARRVLVSLCPRVPLSLFPFQLFHPLSPAWCVRLVGSFGLLCWPLWLLWLPHFLGSKCRALAWRLIPRATVEGLQGRTNPPPSISRPPSMLSTWARTRVMVFPILASWAPSPCHPWHTVEAPGRLQGWQCRLGPIMTSSRVGAAETNVSIAGGVPVPAVLESSRSPKSVPDNEILPKSRRAAFFFCFFFSWPCSVTLTRHLALVPCVLVLVSGWLEEGFLSRSRRLSRQFHMPPPSMPCILATDRVP